MNENTRAVIQATFEASNKGAFNCGGPSMVALNFYRYGDQAAETAARETPLWQAWMQEHFPAPPQTSEGA